MATYLNPSNSFRPLSEEMGRVFRYAGHHAGFIASGTTLIADVDSVGLTAGPHNAFVKADESGLDVTIDTGEAVIAGLMVGKDTQTVVTLPPSSSPTVSVAIDPSTENNVIIDHGGNIPAGLPQLPLYDFTTDTSNVTGETDQRPLGEHIDVQNQRYEGSNSMPVDTADNANALGGDPPGAFADATKTSEATTTGEVISLRDVHRFGSCSLPISDIPAGGRARDIVFSTPEHATMHILRTSITDNAGSSVPSGVILDIKDNDGQQVYQQSSVTEGGTYASPIHTLSGLGFVRVEIFNGSSNEQTLQAECHYILE